MSLNLLERTQGNAYYLAKEGYRGEGLPPDHPNRRSSFWVIWANGRSYRVAISDMAEGAEAAAPDSVQARAQQILRKAGY